MKNLIFAICFIITSIVSPLRSEADDMFDFDYDYSLFKTGEDKYILELYFSFYQKGLAYLKVDGDYHAKTTIGVKIQNASDGNVIFDEMYGMPSVVSDTSGNELEQRLLGQVNLQLSPGEYVIRVTGTDENEKNNFQTIEKKIDAEILGNSFSVSDIQLASGIKKSNDQQSVFYKNTLEVIPNPGLLFGNNLDRVYYYYEVYGLNNSEVEAPVTIHSSIKDLNNNVIVSQDKKINSRSASLADYGSFSIDSLPSASYMLSVEIKDQGGHVNLISDKKFFVYNSNVESLNTTVQDNDQFLISEYATMREELLDLDFEISLYLRDLQESAAYRNLTSLDDKRRFMFNFWKKRDNVPGTLQNEFKAEYIKRIQEANNLFNEPFKEGWRTDRGRIYVTYGKPDVIDRYPFEHDKVGYEVWTYERLEGGSTCVFGEVLPSGSGIYDLIHSTIRGELRNDNWEAQLRR